MTAIQMIIKKRKIVKKVAKAVKKVAKAVKFTKIIKMIRVCNLYIHNKQKNKDDDGELDDDDENDRNGDQE